MQLDVTTIIVIITSLISISAFSNHKIMDDLIFYPPAITHRQQWYRFFTCGLIHADYAHLIFNMVSLYMFGRFVEQGFIDIFGVNGKWIYLLMYVSSLFVCLLPTYFRNKENYNYRGLGASGAVSAVVFAGLLLAPHIEVGFFFIPPIIPGFIFGPIYLIITIFLDKRGGDNINHSAHLWGALFGLIFIFVAGKMVEFDAIDNFTRSVQYYLRAKGWTS